MRSRKLTHRVQIWQKQTVEDGYGGNTTKTYQITDSWADVSTMSDNSKYSRDSNDFGIIDKHNAIVVKMRKRNDIDYNSINQYLVFKGVKYIIAVQPSDVNFNKDEIVLIATRESIKNVVELDPIGNVYLATKITDEYVLRVTEAGGNVDNETCLYNYILSLL